MAKILIVEDERDLSGLVSNWLTREKHLVEQTDNGLDALNQLELCKFDIIILDLMLPGMNGMEVCRRYRQKLGYTPILMLTAKSTVEDKEAGLDAGADDYLTKPFQLKELAARVRALLRRGLGQPTNVLHIRDITIDTNECLVKKASQIVHLLPKEYRLLAFLARHPNHVFSAEELLSSVWESDTPALLDTVRGTYQKAEKKIGYSSRTLNYLNCIRIRI